MPTTPQPPARPAPQPQQQAPRPAQPANPVNRPANNPVNQPQGSAPYTREPRGEAPTGRGTVGPAQTYPPGSRHARDVPDEGPDPQESKLWPYELEASRAQEEPVRTIAQEQRERSADYEAEGVERVKARLDDRDPNERPRTVPGVSPTQLDADDVDRRIQANRP